MLWPILCPLLLLCAPAAAPPSALPDSGNAILARIDARLQSSGSQVLLMDMCIEDPGHPPRKIGMRLHMAGERRRIQFLYPGDMKGIEVLNLSPAQTYVYMPAFGKVRRIASHLRDQTLFGSDYHFDDFGTISLHDQFDAEVIEQTPTHWTLRARPKPARTGQVPPRLDLCVQKADVTVQTIKFFDATDQHVRTEHRDRYRCDAEGCAPTHTKMIDHRHNDHWTEVTIKELQLGAKIPDRMFSLRSLQRQE